VRRALGRLVASATVHDLPHSQLTLAIGLRSSGALQAPDVYTGRQEVTWRPTSQVRQTLVPQAQAGGRNGSLLPTVQMGQGNAALPPPVCYTMPTVAGGACAVENADLLLPGFVIGLPDDFLRLPPVPVRVKSVGLLSSFAAALPRPQKLSGWSLNTPKTSALRLPRVAPPRVIWGGDSVLSRIALTRRCQEAPPEVPFALAFGAEEKRLAEATHLPSTDVTLLGVYPGVPLLAVSRIVVADGGRSLLLWLKPEVLRARSAPRLITLLVGRQLSSGKILQAVL
jgi:hypothetical protein